MLNRIRGWFIDLLSPSYRLIELKALTPEEKKFLTSKDHNEFKKVLFRAMAERINENTSILIKGQYRSDRECGNYQGAIRALADIIEMTTRMAEPKNVHQPYEDIMKKIVQDMEKDV